MGALFAGADRVWTVPALAAHLGLPYPTTAKEINHLRSAGIAVVEVEGRNRRVVANWGLPWALDLARLLDKTVGPLGILAEALPGLAGLDQAWIFGSWARRYHGEVGSAPRDIDVVLVGDVNELDAYVVADRVAEAAGVPVNPYFVSLGQWESPEETSFVNEIKGGAIVRVPMSVADG